MCSSYSLFESVSKKQSPSPLLAALCPAMSSSSVAASSVMASGAGSGSAAGHDDVLMSSGNTGQSIHRVTDNGVAISGLCWFECGQAATQNQGTVRYPKLVCGPCRSANRALVSQITEAGKVNPDVKAAYHKMVKLNPNQFKNDQVRKDRDSIGHARGEQ